MLLSASFRPSKAPLPAPGWSASAFARSPVRKRKCREYSAAVLSAFCSSPPPAPAKALPGTDPLPICAGRGWPVLSPEIFWKSEISSCPAPIPGVPRRSGQGSLLPAWSCPWLLPESYPFPAASLHPAPGSRYPVPRKYCFSGPCRIPPDALEVSAPEP